MQLSRPPQTLSTQQGRGRSMAAAATAALIALLPDTGFAALKGGTEFRVNSNATGAQRIDAASGSALHMNAAGNWVMSWTDDNGVSARVFDSDGTPLTPEFSGGVGKAERVNAAIDNTGNVVLTFTRLEANGGDLNHWNSDGVMLRRFDHNGIPLEQAVDVPNILDGHQRSSAVDFRGGEFIVTFGGENIFTGDGEDVGRTAYRFSDGMKRANSAKINTNTLPGNQGAPTISINASGQIGYAWMDQTNANAYFRLYNDVNTPKFNEVIVNDANTQPPPLHSPSVGIDRFGNAIVVWHSDDSGADGTDIFMRRLNASGNALHAAPVRVNSVTTGDQQHGRVAINETGEFVIVWMGSDASGTGVYMRTFDRNGNPQGVETRVNQTTAGDQEMPVVDINDAGLVTVAWSGNGPGDSQGIVARIFKPDSDGDGITDDIDACPAIAGDASADGCPDADGDGIPDASDACPTTAGDASAQGCPDADGDGVRDTDDAFPNDPGETHDTDGDGIGDNSDAFPHVRNRVATKGVTLTITPGFGASTCEIDALDVAPVPASPALPGSALSRLASFTLVGCSTGGGAESVEVSIDFGETPPAGGRLYKLMGDEWIAVAGASISGQTATYTVVDNGPYDVDATDGVIRDPVTIAAMATDSGTGATQPIPVLSPWLLILLAGLTGWYGARRVRG
ncbi:choice-of-anchor U domain-containing protein [Parahaliea mediterranea]|uniref:choice-of-anchor U domain-containing protein n=1 Tax=Parahaliea mediterranea TaxID=651086 RepID=UPI001F49CD01|nr:choice-of-anchor U domain-containing protein [Parahaliea mediterranea]